MESNSVLARQREWGRARPTRAMLSTLELASVPSLVFSLEGWLTGIPAIPTHLIMFSTTYQTKPGVTHLSWQFLLQN